MTNEERLDKIDARIEAIAMHWEVTASMAHASVGRIEKIETGIEKLLTAVQQDAENIRALARKGGERNN